jgi:hypothetical protein
MISNGQQIRGIDEFFASTLVASIVTNAGTFAKNASNLVTIQFPFGTQMQICPDFPILFHFGISHVGTGGKPDVQEAVLPHSDFEKNEFMYNYRTDKVGYCK